MFVLLPPVILVATAMTQKLNIGLRHILPVYPFALMLCAVALAWLWRRKLKAVVIALGLLNLFEFARVYPHPLAGFNTLAGGPANGYRLLVDSNLDWGQDLKGLKHWMDAHDVTHINLAYFGTADPAYYGLD